MFHFLSILIIFLSLQLLIAAKAEAKLSFKTKQEFLKLSKKNRRTYLNQIKQAVVQLEVRHRAIPLVQIEQPSFFLLFMNTAYA